MTGIFSAGSICENESGRHQQAAHRMWNVWVFYGESRL